MKPSQTELPILQHLWGKGAQSVGEIHQAVGPELNWSRSSTRKTVERMVEKGLLSVSEEHGLNIYRAKARKVPTLAGLIRNFANDVLGLDGPLPVASLVKSRLLDESELAELEALLGQEDKADRTAGKRDRS
ncbi:BlaI/MecI/CopY family transcriptional regulator [Altererythrobacter lutimaris]|uniref:BlaI/MecI/CopY family transcriptional regulator n=1 Tax=Altererythrobacter lutimaris TaxID=2743979 RepID=A0A850HDG8_9SPHN|nr:BlaI/MecI/CopY family transcriptional regulator [Altererythrobacter lutimaris]NVE95151.1 BlaI/MecI/CopY family transcriptional regulator [Altererythrobacter lutimaris]